MADALCVDDQMVDLALLAALNDMAHDLLLVVIVILRKQNVFRAVGNTAPQRNITCMTPHYLNNTAALMGRRSILYLVNGLHGSVYRRVKADSIIRAGNIQVYGARNAHRIDPLSGKRLSSAIGTVASDHDHTVNPVLPADVSSLLLIFRLLKLQTSGRAQNGAALLDNVGHVAGLHINDILIQQAVIALFDPLYLQTPINSSTDYRPDGGIHTRCISAAGQNCDCFNFVSHNSLLLSFRHAIFYTFFNRFSIGPADI